MHASKGLAIIMNQLQSIYNSPFKVSHSHPIHNCFPTIASNGTESLAQIFVGQVYYSPVHANIFFLQENLNLATEIKKFLPQCGHPVDEKLDDVDTISHNYSQ